MSRHLVIMGSGETTPTMVEVHKRLLASADGPAFLVETPYGFQENADDLTARTQSYFARSVGAEVGAVRLRDVHELSPAELEASIATIDAAGWVFAGPGSPTYLLDQWSATRLPDVLRQRLDRPGVLVFASAAAATLGRHAIPVYEIYKVGQRPHWREGLDILSAIDLPVVVVPHFDNAEGGNHDTRFCYLGERRLAVLEAELDEGVGLLGIDEHTAAIFDLDAGSLAVAGRGTVTARHRGRSIKWGPGEVVDLADLRAALLGNDGAATGASTPSTSLTVEPEGPADLLDEAAALRSTFRARMERGDAVEAAQAVLDLADLITSWSADPNQSSELPRARQMLDEVIVNLATTAQAGMHDHRDLVGPHVEALLSLRDQARRREDFATADRIREALGDGGVEVRDTPEGVSWELDDPTADS